MNFAGMLALVLLLAASLLQAQSRSQRPEPPDPTAQVPATKAPPPPASKVSKSEPAQPENTFLGEIILVNGTYYLRSGDAQYKLQDQGKGKQFAGQAVEVKGSLDGQNVLHVQAIGIHQ